MFVNAPSAPDRYVDLSYYDAAEKKTKTLSRISDVDMARAKEMFTGGNFAGAELSMRASCVGAYPASPHVHGALPDASTAAGLLGSMESL